MQAEAFGPETTGSPSKFLSEAAVRGRSQLARGGAKELEVPLKGLRTLQEDQTQKLPTILASAQ